ncbi:hypothetical protein [Gordonia paraffinivorans]|uniref:hypothetical protein n=1 Tax=Gordonia paraffinivorans TaxID=175628 RepID=UPI0014488023|nr:hypothetical protein [Gordonia paraffinivorans]
MTENRVLHVIQHAILTCEDGVWTGRYGGEDWSVIAGSHDEVLEQMVETLHRLGDDDEHRWRIISPAEAVAAGERTEEGFEARFIDRESYENRVIEAMESQFEEE